MGYAHLSQDERYQIQCFKSGGFSLREIAAHIQRDPSTVSRELRRNATEEGHYEVRNAHRQSMIRRRTASAQPRIDAACWIRVASRLMEGWSPDQIAKAGEVSISHERIYEYIAADRQRNQRTGSASLLGLR